MPGLWTGYHLQSVDLKLNSFKIDYGIFSMSLITEMGNFNEIYGVCPWIAQYATFKIQNNVWRW